VFSTSQTAVALGISGASLILISPSPTPRNAARFPGRGPGEAAPQIIIHAGMGDI
jgi:hypothetical protein